jgi:hypothetical protein
MEPTISNERAEANLKATSEPKPPPPAARIKYPFPLREDFCCFFELPSDLTKAEAERIIPCLRSIHNE